MRGMFVTLGLVAVLLPASAAAQAARGGDWVALRSARVGAGDVAKTAEFYKAAFGMQEVQRYERPNFLEIILNFGPTVEAAKAAATPKVVLISRPAGAAAEGVSNLIFNVGDMDAVLKRATAHGGSIERPPTRSATSGNTIAFVRDPSGNRIELIMAPR